MAEIARAFLVQESAMGQRIARAKAKIKAARIPYRVPSAADLPTRVSGVLAVVFLVFNEGYLATGPETDPLRHDLTAEAIRLARLMRGLLPDDGEVAGLLALMPRSSPMGTGSCARDSPPALRPAGPCGFQGSQRRLAGGQEGEQHAPGQAKRAGGRSGWLGQPSRSANPIRMPSGPRT